MSDAVSPSVVPRRHPLGRTLAEWTQTCAEWGEKPYRARQIFRWLHVRGELDPAGMTDLSLELRNRLRDDGLTAPAEVLQVHRAADGTRKLVLGLADGARVECVLIPMSPDTASERDADAGAVDEDDEDDRALEQRRVTLCVSTQFGCAMGCVFCASGQAGLVRGLGAHEVVAQLLIARKYLEPDEYLRNVVFMGMGEPLHHYDETAAALRLIAHEGGIAMSLRRVTVSTVGLVPGIARLGRDFGGKVGLALSLHAPDDETRGRIVPMTRRYPVASLIQALRDYPLPPRRRVTIEYTLIDGVNDSDAHARRLAAVLHGLRVKVNVIPMNGIAASHWRASERVQVFREALSRAGLSCFVRTRRGDDVSAACGQLAMADGLVRRTTKEVP